MIPCNFDYYRPESLQELDQAIREAPKPFQFLAGGTEIVTLAQAGEIAPKAVIDLKAIPICNRLAMENGGLHMGAALTLTQAATSGLFPLLGSAARRISDHTNQGAITLGGNICGTIIYREAVLPLLLAEAQAGFFRGGEIVEQRLADCFHGRLRREEETALLYFCVEQKYLDMPYVHVKKVKNEKIDYPLITLAALKTPEGVRVAVSGLCSFPFLVECAALADQSRTPSQRAEDALKSLPEPPRTDRIASAGWRAFLFKQAVEDTITELEAGKG
ncbi:MAG: FAD binding domain-containing protein [Candidatus Pelethousia sp.]|nr:FAD binding domain-containing protein [Candidatus Pelethousia sp.]